MKPSIPSLLICFAALNLQVLQAGDWGKAPVGKTPIEECMDLGGEISVGYMTDYIFYGGLFAEDSIWMDVNYTFDGLAVPITIGAWYLNSITNPADYDELDLYVSAALGTFAGFDVALGYLRYIYPETADPGEGEVNLELSRSLGFVDFTGTASYNHTYDAWYYLAGISKTFGLTDNIDLVLETGVGYMDNYFLVTNSSNWSHYYINASLPIRLNCRATLTPYVGWNGSPDSWITNEYNGTDGKIHSGVSLSVTF